MLVSAALLVAFLGTASAECPNACSAHGKCGAYDMCTCYRNWMSNDCSERVCQFGLAHVDTPKGDLDASSGALTGPDTLVIEGSTVYPAGTTEQFPNMEDSAQTTLTDTAHYYMECSNKGICDRTSGQCACFEGYSGSACQRASCPDTGAGVCSGHGTCENIKTLSHWDYGNIYKLWDEQATMGCSCDGGWTGSDCSEKICKFGADPLYQDSFQTIRYSNWTYSIVTTDTTVADGSVVGNYSLVLSDATGQRWNTGPIDIDATCADVVSMLEAIPNDVIPADTVLCHKWTNDYMYTETTPRYEPVDTSGLAKMFAKYTLAFPGNPGAAMMLNINHRLDGNRATLYTNEVTSTLKWYIYNNGFYGETTDYTPDLCSGVVATVNHVDNGYEQYDFLDHLTEAEMKLLKVCLGDADGDSTNQADEVYNWDYGTRTNPHLIKLVDATQDDAQYTDSDPTHAVPNKYAISYLCNPNTELTENYAEYDMCKRLDPPGFYAAVYYNATIVENGITGRFRLFSRPSEDYDSETPFHIYTSQGYLNLVSDTTVAFNTWGNEDYSAQIYTDDVLTNMLYTKARSGETRDGLDCETASSSDTECLAKGDIAMVFNSAMPYATVSDESQLPLTANRYLSNPVYPQLYTVKKISNEPVPQAKYAVTNSSDPESGSYPSFIRNQIVLDKAVNARYHWEAEVNNHARDTSASVYKFYPPSNAYEYAGQCSMRGICDTNTGTCNCFGGFTGDNCQRIDALAA